MGRLLIAMFFLASCARTPEAVVETAPERVVSLGDPGLRTRGDLLLQNGKPFSGILVEREPGQLQTRTPYLAGRRHGTAHAYYPDGTLAYEKRYVRGDREGEHRGFWPDGRPQFVYRYERDLFEGEQIAYHESGARSELRHYREGHEEGRQTTWDPAGKIASNYTFKEGKRYGIVGRFDCISVHEK